MVSLVINEPEADLAALRDRVVPRISEARGFVAGYWTCPGWGWSGPDSASSHCGGCGHVDVEEGGNQGGDLRVVGSGGEVAGVEQVQLGVG